jgi:hypothetical protein
MTMKTLSFQKETLRNLVSTELDAVIGGGIAQPTSTVNHGSFAQPTSTVFYSRPVNGGGFAQPTSTVFYPRPFNGGAAQPTATAVSSAHKPPLPPDTKFSSVMPNC